MFYLCKTPALLRWLYPDLLWRIANDKKVIYLTFDDGVTPELTEFIVATLDAFDAKATFFLVGEQVRKYPELVSLLIEKGHHIGNHTQNHCNGWKTNNEIYYQSIKDCAQYINTPLFRPPYGKIKYRQIQKLKSEYKIIMWDLIVGDFDPKADAETCIKRMKKYAAPGSIVVLHDNARFAEKVRYILPRILAFYQQEGYQLLPIPYS